MVFLTALIELMEGFVGGVVKTDWIGIGVVVEDVCIAVSVLWMMFVKL